MGNDSFDRDISTDRTRDPVPSPERGTVGRGLFVGRARELAALQAAFDDACEGRGRLVLVSGDPGIGKTCLCDELTRRAEARGAHVLWGACWEAGGAPAYWPWVQALRSYVRDCDPLRLAAQLMGGGADVAQIIPDVSVRLSIIPSEVETLDADARFRAFDATAEFLARAGAEQPLVIVLDDLHGADESSLLLLQFVVRSLRKMHLLIVGTHRQPLPGDASPILGDLAREGDSLRLAGLGTADVEVLIATAAGTLSVDITASRLQALATAIHGVTEGNPLFVDAMLRLLIAEARLVHGALPLSGGFSVSQQIRAAVQRRLQALSMEARDLLATASVLGRELSVRVLEKVRPDARLGDLLREAEGAGIIVAGGDSSAYRFSHLLIRDCLYEGLLPSTRALLHRSVAQTLESFYAADPDHFSQVAYHFLHAAAATGDVSRSQDVERATAYAARAGERAVTMLGYEEAASCYERALQALQLGEPAPRRRCELLLALGDAYRRAGDGARSRAAYLQAADVARAMMAAGETHMAESLARAALGLGTKGFWGTLPAGEVDEILVRLIEEALTALGSHDSVLRAQLLSCLALALYWSPESGRRASRLSAEAVAIARRLGDPVTRLMCGVSDRVAGWTPDNVFDRLAAAIEMLRLAAQVGHREFSLFSYAMHLCDAMEIGDIDAVRRDIAAYAPLAEELRQPLYLWWLAGFRMMLALLAGRLDEGDAMCGEMLALGQGARPSDASRVFGMTQFSIRRDRGGLEEMAGMTEVMNEQFRAFPVWRCGVALLLAEIGRSAEAQQELDFLAVDEFAALRRDMAWLACTTMLAEAAALLHDHRRASTIYDLLLPYRERVVVAGFGFGCWGSVSRQLGVLAGVLSRWEEAAQHFQHAIQVNERMGVRLCLARTQVDHASMLLSRRAPGDRQHAEFLLGEALAIAHACGAHRLAEQAQRLRGGVEYEAAPHGVALQGEPSAVFQKEGEHWLVAHGDIVQRLGDSKGLRYIHHLLAHPDREFHVVGLARAVGQGRAEAASQMDAPAATPTERARVNVTRCIGTAIRRIRTHDPTLGRYLATTIRTGTFCSYAPDPSQPLCWHL